MTLPLVKRIGEAGSSSPLLIPELGTGAFSSLGSKLRMPTRASVALMLVLDG
jgi:hypothetical protein